MVTPVYPPVFGLVAVQLPTRITFDNAEGVLMNSQTGDIFQVFDWDEKTMKANFGVPLTLPEATELKQHTDTQVRLRRYKQMHADDRCEKCALILRQHTLKEYQYCQYVLVGGDLKSPSV